MTSWNYNAGAGTLACTFDSTPGVSYGLRCNDPGSSGAFATAVGSSLTLTVTGISGLSTGVLFEANATNEDNGTADFVAVNVFAFGTSSFTGAPAPDATWTYNGSTGFSVEFVAPNADNYSLGVNYMHGFSTNGDSGTHIAGTADTTCSVTASLSILAGSGIWAFITNETTGKIIASRLFVQAVSGAGSPGNPGNAFGGGGGGETWAGGVQDGAGGIRVGVAFDDQTLEPSPTWTDVTALQPTLVVSYDIQRGRQYELDMTDAGTCTITVVDRSGVTDPTNSTGPYYQKIEPDLQIIIDLWDPVAQTWSRRYRGWIEDYDWIVDDTEQFLSLTITCYDIFALLTAIEMQPGAFGDAPVVSGTVFYDNNDFQGRIEQVLNADCGVDPFFYVVFTGNVELLEATYSPGDDPLQVIQDCVDAEFPGVANVYPDRFGRLAAHGRLAKFDPDGVSAGASAGAWLFREWKVGDEFAFIGDGATVQMRPPFSFNRGRSKIINSALCYPSDFDTDVDDLSLQLFQDAVSIAARGYKSWSKENLIVKTGTLTGNDGKDECLLYATFYVTNAAQPRNRITALTVKTLNPEDDRAGNIWDMLCNSDIADRVLITVTQPGGGGFNLEPYFIEGINETAVPLTGDYAFVTQSYDLSPAALFTGDLVGLDGN